MFFATAAEQVSGHSSGMEMLIMLFLFLGMWFLLIAPQKKKQNPATESQAKLPPNWKPFPDQFCATRPSLG